MLYSDILFLFDWLPICISFSELEIKGCEKFKEMFRRSNCKQKLEKEVDSSTNWIKQVGGVLHDFSWLQRLYPRTTSTTSKNWILFLTRDIPCSTCNWLSQSRHLCQKSGHMLLICHIDFFGSNKWQGNVLC